MTKKSMSFVMISAALAALGILLAVLKIGFKFDVTSAASMNLTQLWLCMLAAVIFGLLYGFVRFDRANATALAAATLHDLLLTFALSVLLSLVLPGLTQVPAANTLPAVLMLTVLCTYCQTMLVMRDARMTARTTSRKDVSYEDAAKGAVASSRPLRLRCLVMALLFAVAAAVGGGMGVLSVVAPLLLAMAVSYYSAESITPYVWAACAARMKVRKAYR